MKFVAIISFLIFLSCDFRQNQNQDFEPAEGDLFFQDIDCGSYCDAIGRVTVGYKGCKTSHVGVYVELDKKPYIIEARSSGVVSTPLEKFLSRNLDSAARPKVFVGRLESVTREDLISAKKRLLSLLGQPYDDIYIPRDSAYYCSELVQECFLGTGDKPFFSLSPMTFIDPETDKTFEEWEHYFADRNTEVPEGKPGINPGGISTSPLVSIVHFYGYPDGCQDVEIRSNN